MKLDKKQNRLRRARKVRAKISELEVNRLSVHRTPRHIYAQVIAPDGATVIAAASTLEAEVRKGVKHGGNVEAAAIVGARIAEKAKAAGVDSVAFDRSGFRYHGRVKALADAAREAGLKF
jgi:large subunit ribosomal protein L18